MLELNGMDLRENVSGLAMSLVQSPETDKN